MPKKNDLSIFKRVEPGNSVKPNEPKSILAPKTVGRKPKSAEDKESEIVAIKLTKAELAKLSSQSSKKRRASFRSPPISNISYEPKPIFLIESIKPVISV